MAHTVKGHTFWTALAPRRNCLRVPESGALLRNRLINVKGTFLFIVFQNSPEAKPSQKILPNKTNTTS